MSPDALAALAAFRPALEEPERSLGAWMIGGEIEPGVRALSHVAFDPVVSGFLDAAYAHGWVLTDFDWGAWSRTPEALALATDEVALARATTDDLARLLTLCVRRDRFCEGALLSDIEAGLILHIVRRAEALAAEQSDVPDAT
jgi:hypothetical protein